MVFFFSRSPLRLSQVIDEGLPIINSCQPESGERRAGRRHELLLLLPPCISLLSVPPSRALVFREMTRDTAVFISLTFPRLNRSVYNIVIRLGGGGGHDNDEKWIARSRPKPRCRRPPVRRENRTEE